MHGGTSNDTKKHKLNIHEQNIGVKQIHPSQVNFI